MNRQSDSTVIEAVFGQIKRARQLDRFRLRGMEKIHGVWALMAITHNIHKLFRSSLAAGWGLVAPHI